MTRTAAKAQPFLRRLTAFWAGEAGSTAMEYALIASVLAMLGIGGVRLIAGETSSLLSGTMDAFSTATSALRQ